MNETHLPVYEYKKLYFILRIFCARKRFPFHVLKRVFYLKFNCIFFSQNHCIRRTPVPLIVIWSNLFFGQWLIGCDFVMWGTTHNIQFPIVLAPWSNRDFSGFCTLRVQIRSKHGNVTNLACFCLINLTMPSSTFKAFVTWMQKCLLLRSILKNILSVTLNESFNEYI